MNIKDTKYIFKGGANKKTIQRPFQPAQYF